MSTATAAKTTQADAADPGPAPLAFGGRRGWLHRPSGAPGRRADVVVVICPPVGRDLRCAYLFLRALAERVAEAGYPALRFDYLGSGDSLDLDPDADALAVWRGDIGAAVAQARALTGLPRVALCGLRLGATLAALAADDVRADGLMLLAPVEQGRRWLRELKLAAALSTPDHRKGAPAAAPGLALESDGLQLSEVTVAALARLDLGQVAASGRETLLVSPAPALQAPLAGRSERLAVQPFEGLAELFDETHSNIAPQDTLEAAVRWLTSRFPLRAGAPVAVHASGRDVLRPPGGSERAVRFGEGLQGVLCTPDAPRPGAAGRIAILCNTGGDPRVGAGRLSVDAARRLAREGVASLRFDFAGLGDSPREGGRGHVYEVSRHLDFQAAVSLAASLGYTQPTLVGVCTGAYHAFWAAAADPRVSGLYLVSLVKFVWQPGDSLDFGRRDEAAAARTYVERLRSPDTWMRFLKGRVRVGAIARSLARRMFAQLEVKARGEHAPVREAARGLAARGVRAELLLGLEDAAMDELETYFGKGGRLWTAAPGLAVDVVPTLDHGLLRASSRAACVERLAAFMTQGAAARFD